MPRASTSKSKFQSRDVSSDDDLVDISTDEENDDEDDLDQSEGQEVYHVEVITAARVGETEDGNIGWEYFVKWANYPDSDSSWEPECNVQGCQDLIADFWNHVGQDDDDYKVGYEVHAKKQWINVKKDLFKKTFQSETENKKSGKPAKRRESKRSGALQPGKSKKRTSKSKPRAITVDTSGDDDEPLIVRQAEQFKLPPITLKRKRSSDEMAVKVQKTTSGSVKSASSSKNRATEPSQKRRVLDDLFPPSVSPVDLASGSQPAKTTVSQSTSHQSKPIAPATSVARSLASRTAIRGIPAHRQRQINPQVKMIDIPSAKVGGSTLTTKSRIAQALPVIPGFIGPKSSSLSHLSFKKNKIRKPTLISGAPEAKQPSPKPRQEDQQPSMPMNALEDHETYIEPAPEPSLFSSMHENEYTLTPEPLVPPYTTETKNHDQNQTHELDSFLLNIMPEGLSAPLEPSEEETGREAVGSLSNPKVKLGLGSKLTKIWKWSGELSGRVSVDKTEKFCEVMMQEPTEHKAEGLRFSFFFQKTDSLHLEKLYDVADINHMILPSCGPVHQFARLVPKEDKDIDALDTLFKYMSSMQKAAYAPLSFANEIRQETDRVAHLFIFPPDDYLCSRLSVPDDMRHGDRLIVALVPSILKQSKYQQLQWREPIVPRYQDRANDDVLVSIPEAVLKYDFHYARALRSLKIPEWLYEFIPGKAYCIWFAPVDGTEEDDGVTIKGKTETQGLVTILDRLQARNVGYKADVQMIFVHIGALAHLCKLPGLSEKKYRDPEIQFITYGTHSTVTPFRWGIREIYPLGAIITFTPNVILRDVDSVLRLIKRVKEHKLFDCFILPSVVGLALKMGDEIGDKFTCDLISDGLLDSAVDGGEIALMDAPSMDLTHADFEWVNRTLEFPGESTSLVGGCRKAYDEKYAKIPSADCQSAIMEDICANMLSIQLQPVMMDNYRRWIVITHASDKKAKPCPDDPTKMEPAFHECLEWHTLTTFKFGDGYFEDEH